MRGEALTVFEGTAVTRVPVAILGVLENTGPKRSLILVRLEGEAAQRTGVAAGMSGSPVYVDGRWIGALAFAFPFAKEPIGAVRPAEEMVAELRPPPAARNAVAEPNSLAATTWRESVLDAGLARLGPSASPPTADGMRPIITPVSLAGFTPRTLEVFGDRLRGLGLQPMQGAGGTARSSDVKPGTVEPGSMISVSLVEGDLRLSAAGTVSHVDGNKLYAFGHRFLASGSMRMPFAPAHVLATVPNLENSFKIAAAGQRAGVILYDHDTGIRGEIGADADLIPVNIRFSSDSTRHDYSLEIVRDELVTPFLMQLAVFSALDATLRSAGAASIGIEGTVSFEDHADLRTREYLSAHAAPLLEASQAAVVPLAYLLQNAGDASTIQTIDFEFTTKPSESLWKLGQPAAERTTLHAGETVTISIPATSSGGGSQSIDATFTVPESAPPGRLVATFAGGADANALEWPVWYQLAKQSDPAQMVTALNRLRPSNRLYLRLSTGQPAYALAGTALRNTPGSVNTVLSNQFGQDMTRVVPNAPFREIDLGAIGGPITGVARLDLTVVP